MWTRDFDYSAKFLGMAEWRSPRSLRRTLLNPGNAIALARRSARLNIRASEAMRAGIASRITISAKLLVGVAVLSRPTPPTTAKPERRVVLARGYLQVGIGDPKLSILFAWKMQYALTLTVVPFEFHLPPIVTLGWDGH